MMSEIVKKFLFDCVNFELVQTSLTDAYKPVITRPESIRKPAGEI